MVERRKIAIAHDDTDHKYFTQIQNMLCDLIIDPLEGWLWVQIKRIATQDGECYLSTPDLAALAGMSVGKVVQCRRSLIAKGLLEGDLRKDPGYPQPVYHLRVPDLWPDNTAWAQARARRQKPLRAEIERKRELRAAKKQKSVHLVKPSPGEQGPSPGEQGPSPGEQGPSPGETKKNQRKSHKEEPKEALQSSFYITETGVKVEY